MSFNLWLVNENIIATYFVCTYRRRQTQMHIIICIHTLAFISYSLAITAIVYMCFTQQLNKTLARYVYSYYITNMGMSDLPDILYDSKFLWDNIFMNFSNDLRITKILASKILELRMFSSYEYFNAVSKGLSAITKNEKLL